MMANGPKEALKIKFAKNLKTSMVAKGWGQSDLARYSETYLPKNKRFGRDSISLYTRGKSLPRPLHLLALAKALGVKPEELLPTQNISAMAEASPSFEVRDLSDGTAWLKINQAVPWSAAIEITKLIKGTL